MYIIKHARIHCMTVQDKGMSMPLLSIVYIRPSRMCRVGARCKETIVIVSLCECTSVTIIIVSYIVHLHVYGSDNKNTDK